MPANLPPQYHEAEKAFRQARAIPEKIEALENMLAIMPHHKGTDHLRAELRTRLAKLREEEERRPSIARRGAQFRIVREGAGQIALVGQANAGKSELFASLTGVPAKVADYPFTTQSPSPGMMRFENVQFQLVDLPAVDFREAHSWLYSSLRDADLLLVVVDLSQEPLSQARRVEEELATMRVRLHVAGDAPSAGDFQAWKKAIIVGSKSDVAGAADNFQSLRTAYGPRFPVAAVSALDDGSLASLGKTIFQALEIKRIYCKEPGRQPDLDQPSVLRKDATVEDFAESIHKDLRQKLKYALVWGSGRFAGQQVNRSYVPLDGDIVELRT
ncbi:MAG: 50S ribosome-binding GTPase [Chloroflexi bacterium]|nr:50S ribosome-binding GTPase [Chloroflexota bacterium]